jgi:hypothetical protein
VDAGIVLLLLGLALWLLVEALSLYRSAAAPHREPARDCVAPAAQLLESALPPGWKLHAVRSRGLQFQIVDASGSYRGSVWITRELLDDAEAQRDPAWLARVLRSRGVAEDLLARLGRGRAGALVVHR